MTAEFTGEFHWSAEKTVSATGWGVNKFFFHRMKMENIKKEEKI